MQVNDSTTRFVVLSFFTIDHIFIFVFYTLLRHCGDSSSTSLLPAPPSILDKLSKLPKLGSDGYPPGDMFVFSPPLGNPHLQLELGGALSSGLHEMYHSKT